MRFPFLSQPAKPASIRSRTIMLVLACALPTVVGFATLSYDAYTRQQAQSIDAAEHMAMALLAGVERDLTVADSAARALATSPALHAGALAAVRQYADRLVGNAGSLASLEVRAANGELLFVTHPVPARAIAIEVPARIDDTVRYVVTARLRGEGFDALLRAQNVPDGWIAQIFDAGATIVARNRNPHTSIGKPASGVLVEAMARQHSGVVEMMSREHQPLLSAFQRSERYGWFVAVGVPRDAARGALDATLHNVWLAIGALLATGLATSWLIGGAISRSVRALTGPAAALGRGEPLNIPATAIRETAEVADALRQVDSELRRYRGDLEQLVRARTVELERSNALLATVHATAPVGLVLLDADLRVAMINDYLAAINAMPVEAHLGRSLPELFGQVGVRYEALFRQVRDSGKPLPVVEVTVPAPNEPDSERHLMAGFHPVFGADRELVGISAVVLDITPRIAAEQELQSLNAQLAQALERAEQASRAKTAFLANVSHEIRTPMHAIMGLARLLQEAPLARREREYVNKMTMSTRSLLGILNDVLDFSKIEAGQLELEQAPFALEQVLRSVSVLVEPNAAAKGVELVFDVDPATPPVLLGDSLRLEQILLNLTGNAVKFTQQGEVVLSVRMAGRHGEHARIGFAVRDTGIGISTAQLATIFDAFSQGDSSTSRQYGGTGLGLAICRRLVGLMGGAITVRSAPGQGSQFAFELGFHTQSSLDEAAPAPAGRLLLVDDNASSRAALASRCAALGWDVDSAAGGEQALACLHAHGYAAYRMLLVDSAMPDMDGVTLLTIAREQAHGQMPPCVMMAAESARARLDELAGELRLAAVLGKPVLGAELARALGDNSGSEPAPEPPALAGRLAGLRVLLVEDNQINQEVAHYILLHAGASVDIAANGRIAVDMLAAHPEHYDAVLMDVQMPVLNGYEATAEIRRQGLDLPIVAMTANVTVEDRLRAQQAGMNGHLAKPIDVDSLIAALEQLARRAGPPAPPALQAPATPTPAAAAMPAAIPGIDLAATLKRFGGDHARWVALLKRLELSHGGAPAELRALIGAGRRDEAKALLHRLRGVAANLGAVEVAAQARHIEQALATAPETALLEQVADLGAALGQVFDAARMLDLPAQAPTSAASAPEADPQAALAHLLGLLHNNNLKAIAAFDALRPALGKWLADADLLALAASVSTLDFAGAAARVETLLASQLDSRGSA